MLGKEKLFLSYFSQLTAAKSGALHSARICIAVTACARKDRGYTVCRGHLRVIEMIPLKPGKMPLLSLTQGLKIQSKKKPKTTMLKPSKESNEGF